MSAEWYVARPGQQQVGPLEAKQLKQMAATGQVSGSDLVWKQGMPQWVPASSIKGLVSSDAVAPMPQAAPQPMPSAMAAPDPFGGGGGFEVPSFGRTGDASYYRLIESYAPLLMWLGIGLSGLMALATLVQGIIAMMAIWWVGLLTILLGFVIAFAFFLAAILGTSTMRVLADMGRTLRSMDKKTGSSS
jgi:hypothetical protein